MSDKDIEVTRRVPVTTPASATPGDVVTAARKPLDLTKVGKVEDVLVKDTVVQEPAKAVPKSEIQPPDPGMAAKVEELAQARVREILAEQNANKADPAQPALDLPKAPGGMFMAKYPSLTIYAVVEGEREPLRVDFKNGVFKTEHDMIAEALRKHSHYKKLFREDQNIHNIELRARADMARAGMLSATKSGVTGSTDGNDMRHAQNMGQLDNLEQQLFTL